MLQFKYLGVVVVVGSTCSRWVVFSEYSCFLHQ